MLLFLLGKRDAMPLISGLLYSSLKKLNAFDEK